MKIIGITQARYGSRRFPGKVTKQSAGNTLLHHHLHRITQARCVSAWVLATTNESEADALVQEARTAGIDAYQGSLEDVLDRFYQAAKPHNPDYVVRVTADCPLLDAALIDDAVERCLANKLPYFLNCEGGTLPDGMDVEVFAFNELEKAWKEATLPSEREHVTPYIRKNLEYAPVKTLYPDEWQAWKQLRMTLDEPADFVVIDALINKLGGDQSWQRYARELLNNSEINQLNSTIGRNEGYLDSVLKETQLRSVTNFAKSDAYRRDIHKLIPGGCHTYSKGDDQFPQRSPAAITRGRGSHVWDADGNEYLDCSMGLTSVTLGHAFEPIVGAVKTAIDSGVNFQRPSTLEKAAAERFLSLVPQHDMIKFSKNGSIVTTAAVKLARAKTGRKLVAFPGDHPFYSYDDWFIGTTACSKGVPEEISALSVTFDSCSIESLEALFAQYPDQIACVITEPERSMCRPGCEWKSHHGAYLKQAIDITHKHGALFILDEMVTGFKTALPGCIAKYDLHPDMATWGKSVANGFSFCALTGKRDVMDQGSIVNEGAEKVFLSSTTHGGETHGLAASMACIDFYQQHDVIKRLHATGASIVHLCSLVVAKHGLQKYIDVLPCDWMPTFVFKDKTGAPSQGLRTLFMQEMIAKGVLFQGVLIPCFSHSEDDVHYFVTAFNHACGVYVHALEDGYERYLVGKPAQPVFRKYL